MGGATVFCAVQGTSGHSLHDGNEPMTPSRGYAFKNGRSYAETVTNYMAIARCRTRTRRLRVCTPVPTRRQYAMPRGIRTCDDTMGLVVQPVMKAGDVLFFMDGGFARTVPWCGRIRFPDVGVLIKYQSKNVNWGGGVLDPQDRWGDMVEDMTEAQFAVMRGSRTRWSTPDCTATGCRRRTSVRFLRS